MYVSVGVRLPELNMLRVGMPKCEVKRDETERAATLVVTELYMLSHLAKVLNINSKNLETLSIPKKLSNAAAPEMYNPLTA